MNKRGRLILVVDDEPYVCSAYKLMFKHDGHTVHIAHNGTDALDLLELHAFDLMVTDYSMLGMKGDELAAIIRQRRPHLPIIMITAHADALQSSGHPLTGIDSINRAELYVPVAKLLEEDRHGYKVILWLSGVATLSSVGLFLSKTKTSSAAR